MHNIIFHITTACNFDCSYCDVIKDKRFPSKEILMNFRQFVEKNYSQIGRVKFFGGEPLLNFKEIKNIVLDTTIYVGKRFEIVSNASLLNDTIAQFLSEYFEIIFLSLDTENDFNFEKIVQLLEKNKLSSKTYINLVIQPGKQLDSLKQLKYLAKKGIKNFNILPVYFTKEWSKIDLKIFSSVMKEILSLSLKNEITLYGFQENKGPNTSLSNNTIFIDIDGNAYYSDLVSTYKGSILKEKLFLMNIKTLLLDDIGNTIQERDMKKSIDTLEEQIENEVSGQKELHQIMDYFSEYINKKQTLIT